MFNNNYIFILKLSNLEPKKFIIYFNFFEIILILILNVIQISQNLFLKHMTSDNLLNTIKKIF